MGVIAINMDLYNAGATTPVGVFLVLSQFTIAATTGSGMTDKQTDFFLRRLVRLLPMMVVSTSASFVPPLCGCSGAES